MFTMIQSPDKHTRRDIVWLKVDAYVSPAGYIVGDYRVISPSLSRADALTMLTRLFQSGLPCSLWWHGAAEDISSRIDLPVEA